MLLAKGFVREEELVEALGEHERTGRPLGTVLVDRGMISAPALTDALLVQQSWRPLGQLLVDRGVISDEQLAEALEEQEQSGRPLGEIVRTCFFVSASTLGEVIAEQHELELQFERGFGSGLRRGIQNRHQLSRGLDEPAAETEPETAAESPLVTSRLGVTPTRTAQTEGIASLQAALETREETIAALGSANRKRGEEVDALRAELHERDLLIAELERRVAELEGSGRQPSRALPANRR